MAEMIDLVEAVSPWWWVAFGIGLGVLEMVTMSFFLIWPGLAALVMAGILSLLPTMPGELRIALFAVLAVALTFLGRAWLNKYGDGGGAQTNLNNRAALVVGRKAKVLSCASGEGAVEIDGIRWHAVWEGGASSAEGDMVDIQRADGMTLRVTSNRTAQGN